MPKNEYQRLKLLAVKQILEKYTDKDHGITMDRILELLSMRGIKAERKSVYDDIDALIEKQGMNIQKPKGRDFTYRLTKRTFSMTELKWILDSVQSSKFLSEKGSRVIITHLKTLCSKYDATQLQSHVLLANRAKTTEEKLSKNVSTINKAITDGEQIVFKYFDYNIQKEPVYRKKGKPYIVSPYALVYSDENYYLLAYDEEHDEVRPYRVDRMRDVTQYKGVVRKGREAFEKIDLAQYQKYSFSMFGNNVESVTMVFQNRMMNAVIDRFGRDIMVMKEDADHFRVSVKVAVSNQFYGWVFGLGNMVRIVGPEHVKQGMKDLLESVHGKYEDS